MYTKLLSNSKLWFEKYALEILMLLTIAASLTMFFWSYGNGYAVAYGDAASHLNIARRAIDSLTPGAAQLGGIWLPLPHVLMLVFVWSDFLWQSGLAGGILSGLAFLGTVYYIFRLAELLTGSITAAFLAGLVVISNPNLLYLQTTPMGESLFLFSISASAYFLVRWYSRGYLIDLVGAAAFGFASTLIRYEGWFFVLAEFLVIGWQGYQQGRWKRAEGQALTFGFLAGLGPVLWLLWNWAIFGNPFTFLSGDFSARQQQSFFETAGLLPTAHHLWLSIKYYFFSIGENNGFLLSWLCLLLVPIAWWSKVFRPILLIFSSIVFFEILSLYRGTTILYLPYLFPEGSLFNVRYGLLMLPLIALAVAYFATLRHWLTESALALLLIVQIFFSFRELPITLIEPLHNLAVSENKQMAGGHFLKNTYRGGRILVSTVENDPFIFHTGLPIKEFVSEGNGDYWQKALDHPETSVEWIVADAGLAYYRLTEKFHFQESIDRSYVQIFHRKGLSIYQRIPQSISKQ